MSKIITGNDAIKIAKEKCLELLLKLDEICQEHNISYWIDGGTLLGAVRHKGYIPWDDDLDVCLTVPDYHKLVLILAEFCKENNPYILFHGDTGFDYCYNYFGDISYLVDGIYPVRIDLFPMKMVENTPEDIKIDKSWANIATYYFRGYPKNRAEILPIHEHLLPHGRNLEQQKNEFFKLYQSHMLDTFDTVDSSGKLMTYSFNDMLVAKERDYYYCDSLFPLSSITFEGHSFNAPKDVDQYLSGLYSNYMDLPPLDHRVPQLTTIHKNDLSKQQIKAFFESFFKMMLYKNIATARHNSKWRVIWINVISFIGLYSKLVLKLQFKSARNFLRFAKARNQ